MEQSLKTAAVKAKLRQQPDIELQAIRQLVDLYILDRKYGKAELAAWRAVRIGERSPGPDQTAIVPDLCNLSRIYLLEGKEKEHRACVNRTTEILNSFFGPDHLYTKITLFELQGETGKSELTRREKRRIAGFLRNAN